MKTILEDIKYVWNNMDAWMIILGILWFYVGLCSLMVILSITRGLAIYFLDFNLKFFGLFV
jgi:hypothetical protein